MRIPPDIIPVSAQQSDVVMQKVNNLLNSTNVPPKWNYLHKLMLTRDGLVGERPHIRQFLELLRAKDIDLCKELDAYYIPYKVLPEYLLKELEADEENIQVDRKQRLIIANKSSKEKVKQKVYNVTGQLTPDFCTSTCADNSPIQYSVSAINMKEPMKYSVVNVCEECANTLITN